VFTTLLNDAEKAVVRNQLDALTYVRLQTGLAPDEELHYQELRAEEWRLSRADGTRT
jgi:hypothetical protein